MSIFLKSVNHRGEIRLPNNPHVLSKSSRSVGSPDPDTSHSTYSAPGFFSALEGAKFCGACLEGRISGGEKRVGKQWKMMVTYGDDGDGTAEIWVIWVIEFHLDSFRKLSFIETFYR